MAKKGIKQSKEVVEKRRKQMLKLWRTGKFIRNWKMSEEQKKKLSEKKKSMILYNFKGEKAGYRAKHIWISSHYGKPKMCEHCQKDNLTGHFIQWANISGKYLRERADWLRLCVKCHILYDKQKRAKRHKL